MQYNPYMPQFGGFMPQFNNRMQQQEQQYSQFGQVAQPSYPQNSQTYPQPNLVLNGKLVESAEVVKVLETPLDGTVSYFPLTDGSGIITKQLQTDGTTKTTIYKPVTESEKVTEQPKYVTEDKLLKMLENESEGVLELKDEVKDIKRQLRDLSEDLKEVKKIKESKRKSDE